MNGDVPESTRRHAGENRERLEYILPHGSSIEIRDYAGALLIRGLPDPEVEQAIGEFETGREILRWRQVSPSDSRNRSASSRWSGRFSEVAVLTVRMTDEAESPD